MWGRTASGSNSFAALEFPVAFADTNYRLIASPEYSTSAGFEVWLCSAQIADTKKAIIYSIT